MEASTQSTCEKALISLMWEDINKAVNKNYNFEGVQVWNERIISLKMTGGLTFETSVQIDTFIGAHNTIGTDTLILTRELNGLKLISYKPTPSKHKNEILEWYLMKSAQP